HVMQRLASPRTHHRVGTPVGLLHRGPPFHEDQLSTLRNPHLPLLVPGWHRRTNVVRVEVEYLGRVHTCSTRDSQEGAARPHHHRVVGQRRTALHRDPVLFRLLGHQRRGYELRHVVLRLAREVPRLGERKKRRVTAYLGPPAIQSPLHAARTSVVSRRRQEVR